MSDTSNNELTPVPGTTGGPAWMYEPSLGVGRGVNWNDLAGFMAITFHTSGAAITDDQIFHAFHAITGWMMESDLVGEEEISVFTARVRELMGLCEQDRQEKLGWMGADEGPVYGRL